MGEFSNLPYARHYNPLLNTNHTKGQRSQYINELQEVGKKYTNRGL